MIKQSNLNLKINILNQIFTKNSIDANINDIEEIFHAHIIEHNRKYDYYLMKCEFKLIFNDNHNCPYIKSELYSNETMCY